VRLTHERPTGRPFGSKASPQQATYIHGRSSLLPSPRSIFGPSGEAREEVALKRIVLVAGLTLVLASGATVAAAELGTGSESPGGSIPSSPGRIVTPPPSGGGSDARTDWPCETAVDRGKAAGWDAVGCGGMADDGSRPQELPPTDELPTP